MCSWEQEIYDCGHKDLRRMQYSCRINYRHTYGECAFDPRRHNVIKVFMYQDCHNCRKLFEFVNF